MLKSNSTNDFMITTDTVFSPALPRFNLHVNGPSFSLTLSKMSQCHKGIILAPSQCNFCDTAIL